MYPFLRIARELRRNRKAPPMGMFDTHVSHHICWPQDIDPWIELNNGRTLTLYDLGRVVLLHRVGLATVNRAEGWSMTVAGSTVLYRRRIRAFDRFEMRSRLIGWDDKFFYFEQAMLRHGEFTGHLLIRMAVVDGDGIVRTERVAAAGGFPPPPALPDWAEAWSRAEKIRPWPPAI